MMYLILQLFKYLNRGDNNMIYEYILTEATVYDSSGAKLKDALNKYNSMNNEAYQTLQMLQANINEKDPNIINKLDKAITYLKNIQELYNVMDKSIDQYMIDSIKESPEVEREIKIDCANSKKDIDSMRKRDAELINLYSSTKSKILNPENKTTLIQTIVNKAMTLVKGHKAVSSKLNKVCAKKSA